MGAVHGMDMAEGGSRAAGGIAHCCPYLPPAHTVLALRLGTERACPVHAYGHLAGQH